MSGADLSRRQFLQAVAVSSVSAVLFAGCQVPRPALQEQSLLHQPEDLVAATEDWYATTCRLCPAGCGMLARVVDGRVRKVEGNPEHPVNRGKLCARGQAAVQEEYHPDRVTGPLVRAGARGGGDWTRISWNEALDRLGAALRGPQASGHPESVAFLTSPTGGHEGLLLDRFAATHGARWLTLAPLGEAAFRTAAQRVFGQAQLPTFDVANAQTVVSFGADFLDTWVSPVHYAMAYGMFRQGDYNVSSFQPRGRRPRGKFVYVGPHFSATAASADEWVYVRPGTEGILALSIGQVMLSEGLADHAAVAAFGGSGGLEAYAPERVAGDLGVSADRIRRLASDFASHPPSLAVGGGSAGAHTNGTEALSAVLGLNVLVGNVGRPGGVSFAPPPPFALPPDPRTTLRDWQSLVDGVRGGQVDTLLVHRVNPVHNLPAAIQFESALHQAATVISFSSFLDDTATLADLVLPTHLPLEDWGDNAADVSGGPQTVSLQQPVVQPLHDTRSFGDLLLTAAAELGGAVEQALPWPTYKDLLREAADQLRLAGGGSIDGPDLEQFWTRLLQHGVWTSSPPASPPASSATVPTTGVPMPQFSGDAQAFPYILVPFVHNTLGQGETAHLPWLQAAPDPVTSVVWQTWVEVNPQLAARVGLHEGDIVRIESQEGQVEVPVYVNPAASPEILAMPLGQGHTGAGRWAQGRGSNPLVLVSPLLDAATGDLAYAATRVRMTATGHHMPLPKLEGDVPAYQLPGREVLKISNA